MVDVAGPSSPEVMRQYYLAQCGIRAWYPRQPLDGAGASPVYAPDIFAGQVTGETLVVAAVSRLVRPKLVVARQVDGSARAAIARLAESLGGDSVSQAGSSDKGVSEHRERPEPEALEVLSPLRDATVLLTSTELSRLGNVDALIWREAEVLIMAAIDSAWSFNEQYSLFVQIIKASRLTANTGVIEPVHVVWPVFSNRLISGQSEADFIVCMKQLVGSPLPVCQITLGLPLGEMRMTCTGSESVHVVVETLSEMLREPCLKRCVWIKLRDMLMHYSAVAR